MSSWKATAISRASLLFDQSPTGRLEDHELKCAMTIALGYRPRKYEIQRLGGGVCSMDKETFQKCLTSHLTMSPYNEMRHLFHAVDLQRRGFVTLSDFTKAFERVCPSVPTRVVVDAFHEADRFGTGRISFDQFERFLSVEL